MAPNLTIEEKGNQPALNIQYLCFHSKYDLAIEAVKRRFRLTEFAQAYNKLGDYYVRKT